MPQQPSLYWLKSVSKDSIGSISSSAASVKTDYSHKVQTESGNLSHRWTVEVPLTLYTDYKLTGTRNKIRRLLRSEDLLNVTIAFY